MQPQTRYQNDIQAQTITADPAQEEVVQALQSLFEALERRARERRSWLARLGATLGLAGRQTPVQGIYLWGGVGRGKTYLMDLFYDCVPSQRKIRTHFHRFMQSVHQDLQRLQGQKNPLDRVADDIAGRADLLCFDEFFVVDIGDAMILAGLLDALFARGVTLVATSNCQPDELYRNGLQRARFLPAIASIKAHTRVIELRSGTDYRLRSLRQAELYHCPIDAGTEARLVEVFTALAPDASNIEEHCAMQILNRTLTARYCADDVVWFEFAQLCDGPRSAFDYVELAKLFHAMIISDLPQLTEGRNDQSRRFISLVDELHDRRVKLILAAAVPIPELYTGTALRFEFERTQSRLLEMQSHAYLAHEHRG